MKELHWKVTYPVPFLQEQGQAAMLRFKSLEDFLSKVCRPVLHTVYSTFAFDKFPYVLCSPGAAPASEVSAHCVAKHSGGNCYAMALKCKSVMPPSFPSFCVMGNVPKFFMRPEFWGLCHAALFVPAAFPGVLGVVLDPSVYAYPMVVPLPGVSRAPQPSGNPGTVIRNYCSRLRVTCLDHGDAPWAAKNPGSWKYPERTSVRCPPGVTEVQVQMEMDSGRRPCPAFTYALGFVADFDGVITKHVHSIHRGVFRMTTDKNGCFLSGIEIDEYNDSFCMTRYGEDGKVSKRIRIPAADVNLDAVKSALLKMGEDYRHDLRFSKSSANNLLALYRHAQGHPSPQ